MDNENRNYRILIIEDNPGDFALAEDFLQEQFTTPVITHAWDFSEASAILNRKGCRFDVILLDLSLPDKRGESLILQVNNLCGDAPVIVLTGFSDLSFGVKSLSLGIADYILKEDLTAPALYKSILYSMERKRSALALKETERKYSELFHLSPQPMWVIDPVSLAFLKVNKAAINHYGYSRAEFMEMTLKDIYKVTSDN